MCSPLRLAQWTAITGMHEGDCSVVMVQGVVYLERSYICHPTSTVTAVPVALEHWFAPTAYSCLLHPCILYCSCDFCCQCTSSFCYSPVHTCCSTCPDFLASCTAPISSVPLPAPSHSLPLLPLPWGGSGPVRPAQSVGRVSALVHEILPSP